MQTSTGVATESSAASSAALVARLSLMMFLQYWPLGVWGVTVGTYIAANTGDQGEKIFSGGFAGYSTAAGAIGGMLSPLLVGYLSDRRFAAEKLLAAMNMGCGVAAWQLFQCRTQAPFFAWLFVYFQCFSPAVTMTNKIALGRLARPDQEYPLLRVFGTAGWIAAGMFVGVVYPVMTGRSIEATRLPLAIGAIGNALMAAYALTLPRTPPEDSQLARRATRFFETVRANGPLAGFLLVSIVACIPSMAYNNYANLFLNHQSYPHPAALMTLGQASDALCLVATPWLIARAGLGRLFIAGTLAWTGRYLLLAAGSVTHVAWPVYLAILIHGPCYVLIYVVSVLYVDKLVPATLRGSAQGLLAFASTGVGHLVGAASVGLAQAAFLTPSGVDPPPYYWTTFWLIPAAFSAAATGLFCWLERNRAARY